MIRLSRLVRWAQLRSSITSNLDLRPVSAQERIEMEMLERFLDAKEKVPYSHYQGIIKPEVLEDGSTRTMIQEASVRASAETIREALNGGDTRWYKPIGYEPNGTPVMTEDGKEAVRLGYVCPNCFNAQAFPNLSSCKVRGKDWGCGYTRGLGGTVY